MDNSITSTSNLDFETLLIGGDLSKLTPQQRVAYYHAVCKSVGLNPLTKPFEYITLSGKLMLYARKDATDQLRKLNGVSVVKLEKEMGLGGVYLVTAYVQDKTGRSDSSIGAVYIEKLQGEALANAYMKAETKAKRRATLSVCGLGWLDETEVETIKEAQPVIVNHETGEVIPELTKELSGPVLGVTNPKPPTITLVAEAEKPSEAAWKKFYELATKADALGITIPEPPDTISKNELYDLSNSVLAQIKDARARKTLAKDDPATMETWRKWVAEAEAHGFGFPDLPENATIEQVQALIVEYEKQIAAV